MLLLLVGFCFIASSGAGSTLKSLEAGSLPATGCCPVTSDYLGNSIREWHGRNDYRAALCCAAEAIRRSPGGLAAAWVVAASSLEHLGEGPKAASIYAALDREIGPYHDPLAGGAWEYVGPFVTGKGELDGDPLEDYGGIRACFANGNRTARYPSELAAGGFVTWSRLEVAGDGSVSVSPSVDWNFLLQSLSMHEVLEHQGWAITSIFIIRAGAYVVRARGLHTLRIDHDRVFVADLYGTGHVAAVVHLEPGVHTISIHVRAKVRTAFRVSIDYMVPQGCYPEVHPPPFLPDLLDGQLFSDLFSVPVLNVNTTHWIRLARVDLIPPNKGVSALSGIEVVDPVTRGHIAPGQTAPLALRIVPATTTTTTTTTTATTRQILSLEECKKAGGSGGSSTPFTFTFRMTFETVDSLRSSSSSGHHAPPPHISTKEMTVTLRCRQSTESFIYTFIDHDGTVSQAAAVAPLVKSSKKKQQEEEEEEGESLAPHPVILTLHGTGIKPSDQADSYKTMPKKAKRYKFGVKGYWVCAPSRHGAHNWEHTGHRSALAALDALADLTTKCHDQHLIITTTMEEQRGSSKKKQPPLLPPADARRVVFAGHSMGGHGAWQLATHAPDRAIAVVSAAGWLTKEHYGDANALLRLDVSRASISPRLRFILESAVAENDNEQLASNLRGGIPVLARTGDRDATVSPWFSRRYVRQLMAEGVVDVRLSEVPNKEHWWWDTAEANDGGVTNDGEMRAFFAQVLQQASPAPPPSSFTLALYNPATHQGRGGFKVMQQQVPFHRTRLTVITTTINNTSWSHWTLRPDNIRRLRFRPLSTWGEAPTSLTIGSRTFETQAVIQHDLCQVPLPVHSTATWSLCNDTTTRRLLPSKTPATYGPVREVHNRPLWIVVGNATSTTTKGSSDTCVGVAEEEEAMVLMESAMYLANLHYVATSASVRVLRDGDATVEEARRAGVNLVLLGAPWSHSLYRDLHDGDDRQRRPVNDGGDDDLCPSTEDNVAPEGSTNNTPAFHVLPSLSFERHADEVATTTSRSIRLGGRTYRDKDTGIMWLAPWPSGQDAIKGSDGDDDDDDRLMLCITGNGIEGLRNVMRLATPTIPPMTRAPFTNLIPDYVVMGGRVRAEGMGGVLAAGFWGNVWEWLPETAYMDSWEGVL